MRRGDEFRGVAIATATLQNVVRRSSDDFHCMISYAFSATAVVSGTTSAANHL
jgi:hypothetical protein